METAKDTITVTGSDRGEHWLVAGDVVTVRASGRDTSGNLLIIEVNVPAGGGPPVLHRHDYAETFLIQEGEFEISTAGPDHVVTTVRAAAGDTVSIPPTTWHNFKNVGATTGRFIAAHSPAVMEDFMREIGQRIEDPRNPPEPEGPPSEEEMRRMMEIIGRYMEVLPPDKIQERADR